MCSSDLFVGHGLAATFAGIVDEVFHRYRFLAVGADFGRNLESGTTYTARFNFDLYLSVGQLLKAVVKEEATLRIMLLKPDYINQVSSEIPFELSAEQIKNVKAQ